MHFLCCPIAVLTLSSAHLASKKGKRGSFTCDRSPPILSRPSQLVTRRTDGSGEFVHRAAAAAAPSGNCHGAGCGPHL